MSVQQYNQYIMQTIGFTPQDLEANRQGYLSETQKQRFAAYLGQGQRTTLIIAAIVIVITIFVVGGQFLVNGSAAQGLKEVFAKTPYILLIPIGAIVLWFGMIAYSMMKTNRMKDGNVKVSNVTGKVKLTEIRAYGSVGLIMQATSGTHKSYEIKVGRQKIMADEVTIRAFQQGGVYRIYFLKFNPVGLLISAEVAQQG
jgi:hypothetical protein